MKGYGQTFHFTDEQGLDYPFYAKDEQTAKRYAKEFEAKFSITLTLREDGKE